MRNCNLTKKEFEELQAFGKRHGIHDEQTLFNIVKGLNYQEARNAIVGWATCQGVA